MLGKLEKLEVRELQVKGQVIFKYLYDIIILFNSKALYESENTLVNTKQRLSSRV